MKIGFIGPKNTNFSLDEIAEFQKELTKIIVVNVRDFRFYFCEKTPFSEKVYKIIRPVTAVNLTSEYITTVTHEPTEENYLQTVLTAEYVYPPLKYVPEKHLKAKIMQWMADEMDVLFFFARNNKAVIKCLDYAKTLPDKKLFVF